MRLRDSFIGTQLVIVLAAVVVLAFCVATGLAHRLTTTLLEKKMQEQLAAKVQLVKDMIETYDNSLKQHSQELVSVFVSYYPEQMTLAPSQKIQIGTVGTPALTAGGKVQNLRFKRVDKFSSVTGAVATLFARQDDDFVRVATSLKKQDGTRAVGTFLGKEHRLYKIDPRAELYGKGDSLREGTT